MAPEKLHRGVKKRTLKEGKKEEKGGRATGTTAREKERRSPWAFCRKRNRESGQPVEDIRNTAQNRKKKKDAIDIKGTTGKKKEKRKSRKGGGYGVGKRVVQLFPAEKKRDQKRTD